MNYEEAKKIIEHRLECEASVLTRDEIDAFYKAVQALESCVGKGDEGEDW